MLAVQYALKCHHPHHPNYELTEEPDPPRNIRKTAIEKYRESISHLPPPTSQRRLNYGTRFLHTAIVSGTIENLDRNRVLNTRPPRINQDEKTLPRKTRSSLAQLRSGWCHHLNSYKAKINPTEPDICPDCGSSPHDVKHLFNCPNHPTNLKEIDLWKKPVEVSQFLDITKDDVKKSTTKQTLCFSVIKKLTFFTYDVPLIDPSCQQFLNNVSKPSWT